MYNYQNDILEQMQQDKKNSVDEIDDEIIEEYQHNVLMGMLDVQWREKNEQRRAKYRKDEEE